MTKKQVRRAKRDALKLFGQGVCCARDHLGRRVIVAKLNFVTTENWHPDAPSLNAPGVGGSDWFDVRVYRSRPSPAPLKKGRLLARALRLISSSASADVERMRDAELTIPSTGADMVAWVRLAQILDASGVANVAPWARIHAPRRDLPMGTARNLGEQLKSLGIVNVDRW